MAWQCTRQYERCFVVTAYLKIRRKRSLLPFQPAPHELRVYFKSKISIQAEYKEVFY